jgi:hypothetical protein
MKDETRGHGDTATRRTEKSRYLSYSFLAVSPRRPLSASLFIPHPSALIPSSPPFRGHTRNLPGC